MKLQHLVTSLSKEEIRHFKLLSNGLKKTGNRLDFELFNSLKMNESEQAFRNLNYPDNSNAFYRLKNRLTHQINRSLVLLHYGKNNLHDIVENILLADIFTSKEQFDLAHDYLIKAEKKSEETGQIDYQIIVLQMLIKLSSRLTHLNPEIFITKQKDLYKQQEKIRELNDVLAIVHFHLRNTQYLTSGSQEINKLLNELIKKYTSDVTDIDNFQFQYSIFQVIAQHLLGHNEFDKLLELTKEKMHFFESKNLFGKSNHHSKLTMITYIINSSFKTSQNKTSLQYTELLYDEMLKFQKRHYKEFVFFYYQSLVINFQEEKPKKALRILKEIKDEKDLISNPYHIQFILLNLSLLYREVGQLEKSLSSINELIDGKIYEDLDETLQFQLMQFRILLIYELEFFDRCHKHGAGLNTDKLDPLSKESIWIQIVLELCQRPSARLDQATKTHCLELWNLMPSVSTSEESFFDFYEWIFQQIQ